MKIRKNAIAKVPKEKNLNFQEFENIIKDEQQFSFLKVENKNFQYLMTISVPIEMVQSIANASIKNLQTFNLRKFVNFNYVVVIISSLNEELQKDEEKLKEYLEEFKKNISNFSIGVLTVGTQSKLIYDLNVIGKSLKEFDPNFLIEKFS